MEAIQGEVPPKSNGQQATDGTVAPWTAARSRITPGLFFLIGALVQTAVVGYLVSRANFHSDDFTDLGVAKASSLSWSYLSGSVFDHFIPLFRLTDWVLVRVAPFNYSVIRVLQCLLFASGLLVLYRLLVFLLGKRWSVTILTLLAGMSALLTPSLLWWSNGLGVLPTIVLSILTIDSFLRYELTHQRRWIVLATVTYTAGLGFFDSMPLVLVELLLLEFLYRAKTLSPRRLMSHFAGTWGRWCCLLVPTALDLGWRVSNWSAYSTPKAPGVSVAIHALGVAWAVGFVPGALGFSYPRVLGSETAAILLGQALVFGALVVSILRRRSAWRAWLFFAVSLFVDLAVTIWSRTGVLGTNVGLDYRYLAYGPYLAALTLGLAFLPSKLDASPARSSRRGIAPRGAAMLGACAVLGVGGLAYGSALGVQQWSESSGPWLSDVYFANFQHSYSRVLNEHPQAFLYNSVVSPNIQPVAFFPYNTYRLTLGAMFPHLKFDQSRGYGLLLNGTGVVVHAAIAQESFGVLGPNGITAFGGKVASGPNNSVCLSAGSTLNTFVVPLSRTLPAGAWFLVLKVALPKPTSISIVMYDGATPYPGPITGYSVHLPSGAPTTATIALNNFPVSKIALGLPDHSTACVSALSVGTPFEIPG